MTEKEKFFEDLRNDVKRTKILRFLKNLSAERKIEEFKKITGFSLNYFLFLLAEDKIKIIEINNKILYKCPCGTKHMIFKKEKSINTININLSNLSNHFYIEDFCCAKCGQKAGIYGEIKKIEVIF